MRNRFWIENQWRAFWKMVAPADADAPEVQRVEMRRAFFAGVACIFKVANDMDERTEEPTEEDLQLMKEISDELAAYVIDLQNGRA